MFVLWSIACSSGQFIGYWMLDVFVLWSILCSCGQLYWLLDVRCVCFVVNFIFLWSVVLAIGRYYLQNLKNRSWKCPTISPCQRRTKKTN